MKSKPNWRDKLIQSYKYDPLLCHCGATMIIIPDLCFSKVILRRIDKIEFNIKRRFLTKKEKLRRAIFFFAYALPDFNIEYVNGEYEELNKDWNEIDECWNKIDYPRMYCPKFGNPQFVPLDVWKKKNKYKK